MKTFKDEHVPVDVSADVQRGPVHRVKTTVMCSIWGSFNVKQSD